jgi:hypothetical protein
MNFAQFQRLELSNENDKLDHSYTNVGGLYINLEHIEAAVPMKKLIIINSMTGTRYEEHSVTQIHMKSGTKHLVPSHISEVLEIFNVPV